MSNKLIAMAMVMFLSLLSVQLVWAQDITITGVVTEAVNGMPLPGANVVLKGTNNGASTDFDGNYTISNIPEDGILVFSIIGYATREIPVNGRTDIDVTLEESTEQLGEVVVTALGINKERRKLAYAVTEVGSEDLTQAREVNVANSLSGRVAGLVVKGTNSGPGGTAKVTLRGLPSISGTGSPLYVIDGIPMDNTQRGSAGQWGGGDNGDGIGNINPDDIEKMTVLKGQSASALYGSRASNGVILITTKKGSKQDDWSLNYTMNAMMEDAVDFTDFQKQYGQGVEGFRPTTAAEALGTTRFAWGERLDGGSVIGYDGEQYSYAPTQNDYLSFYRTGSNITNSISVSKGMESGSFRLSLSNLTSNSIVPNSDIQRNTVTLNVDQNITDKLNISAMVNYIDQRSDNIPFLSDGPRNPNNFLFLAPNVDHSIFAPGYDPETGAETIFSDDNFVTNPYFITERGINDQDRRRTISMLSAKYNFTSRIYAMLRVGNDISNDKFFSVEPTGLGYTRNLEGALNRRGQSERSELNVDGIFGATVDLTEDIELDALAGANLRKNKFESVSLNGAQFVIPFLYSPTNLRTFNREYLFNEREVHSAYYSVGFGYKDFLTLTTTGRYDVYSTLSSPQMSDNSLFSPSITGAFIFSEFLNMESLSFGKLRASYAVTSGEPAEAYQNQFYYSSGNTYSGAPTGESPLALPNIDLRPFTTSEMEFGMELNFFSNRLTFDIAYFDKKTHDEIIATNLSIASGFNSGWVATGSTRNKGLEVLISGMPVRNENFSWRSSFNLSAVQNKVLNTDENGNPITLGQNRATLGDAVTAYVEGEAGPQIMAYDYAYDESGNIMVDDAGLPVRGDLKTWGTVLPTLYGGWNNEFRYKNFNLSFLIDYNYGNKVLSATEYYSHYRGLHKNTLTGRETGITTNGVAAPAEEYYQALVQNVTRTSVVDGDFIKLRQLAIGYTFPDEMFEKISVLKGVNISLVARNLFFLMRKADNIDPEANFGSTINYTGIEGTSLPSTRSFGVNVNFKLN
ncbi:SusC/RagA family TonB-linked outer membrane protein [Sinomicrobium kalidii]|uniref:SusC/RagA family TonB-linked outer membrane protein n=1 Tax=Sinomicrobium kalidii TaxID=2900738 RepID=UPI001E60D4B6|nr:SusC/RagA family TonB-linked outer membrane protein [Sinomicrobium kalidii]UGU16483.1 SusC/RagA family TonB-linked outer membrane protein [Sinomicrobium kalidii]